MFNRIKEKSRSDRKKIRILFLSHTGELDGAEQSLLLTLRNINRTYFEPIVVLPSSGPLETEINKLAIRTFILQYKWWLNTSNSYLISGLLLVRTIICELLVLPSFIKTIKNEQIDIVYTNSIVTFSGAISASILRIPHIWHIREIIPKNSDLHFFFPNIFLFYIIMKFSSRIIAISNAVAEQFPAKSFSKKIKVIPNGIDLRDFTISSPVLNISKIKPEDWLVTVIGTLQVRKAQADAISAIKIVKEEIPNIKLVFFGDGGRKYKALLKKLVSKLDLDDAVLFEGRRKDILQIIKCFKVVVVPSIEEPFGRVTIEAMASGLPVIGTNSGGTKEIILNGITGYLIPPNSPEEIAKKIITLYKNPYLIQKYGENGRKIAFQKYDITKIIKEVEHLIIDVSN
jgi:glycosyltransferase involved in cell wall biosynthesis